MKGRREKSTKPTISTQLDLFSRPLPPEMPRAPDRLERSRFGRAPGLSKQEARPTPDPLIDYLFGSRRERGRPKKILNAVVSAAAERHRLLDVREAALRLGLSKSTLDKMRCSGRGPRFIRATDRAIRYDPADLDAFAAERRRQSTSQHAAVAVGA